MFPAKCSFRAEKGEHILYTDIYVREAGQIKEMEKNEKKKGSVYHPTDYPPGRWESTLKNLNGNTVETIDQTVLPYGPTAFLSTAFIIIIFEINCLLFIFSSEVYDSCGKLPHQSPLQIYSQGLELCLPKMVN